MKGLTRREIAILCCYALIGCLGLGWVVRIFWAPLGASESHAAEPVSATVPSVDLQAELTQAEVADPALSAASMQGEAQPSLPAILRVHLRWLEARETMPIDALERTVALLSRSCPPAELGGELQLPSKEEGGFVLALLEDVPGLLATALAPQGCSHFALYLDRRLVLVELLPGGAQELELLLPAAGWQPPGAHLRARFCDATSGLALRGSYELTAGELVLRQGNLDGAGALNLSGLAQGPAQLALHFPDRAPWQRTLELQSGDSLDFGVLSLPRSRALCLSLERTTPGPLVFPVLMERLAEDSTAPPGAAESRLRQKLYYPDEQGRLCVDPLAPGRYVLRVPAPGEGFPSPTLEPVAAAPLLVEVEAGGGVEVKLRLQAVQEVELVQQLAASEVLGYSIENSFGQRLYQGRLDSQVHPRLEFVPGSYRLQLESADGERRDQRFEVMLTAAVHRIQIR